VWDLGEAWVNNVRSKIQKTKPTNILEEDNINKENGFMIKALQFIEFRNKNNEFLGMLDSGAQINVMSDDMLIDIEHDTFQHSIQSARGVSGRPLNILGWARVPMKFQNGKEIVGKFAIVNGIQTTCILGLPFLQQTESVTDHANMILMMPEGPLQILEGKKISIKDSRINLCKITAELSDIEMPKLTTEERTQVIELLRRYSSIWKDKSRGVAKEFKHTIILNTERPIKSPPRQFCPEHREAIAQEIRKMLDDKVIRLSNSPYSSELVMVRKKTGDWRVCVDYRLINQHT
jgi:hypothetical protein